MTRPCSAYDKVGGMQYLPRLLDKIRLFAKGDLPPDYHSHLGKGADNWCVEFLRVAYPQLRERVLAGGSNEEILEWCFAYGCRLNQADIFVWNQCITRLGWRDLAAERLEKDKAAAGMSHRHDIQTFADFFDVDEGRKP